MKKQILILALTALFATGTAMAEDVDGLIKVKSEHSVKVTLDRLEKILKSKS